MCGLAGYSGIKNFETRMALVHHLGTNIDSRGSQAAGYVSVSSEGLRFSRKLGSWNESRARFIKSAAEGDLCMMHSRFATCGKRTVEEAHPFAITREGKVKMWGAHNGCIYDAFESARRNKRYERIDVDSQEIFELMVDKDFDALNNLHGYGVITYIEANDPHVVKISRLTTNSDMVVVKVREGGVVWASTQKILYSALKEAGLHVETEYQALEPGKVLEIQPDEAYMLNQDNVKISSGYTRTDPRTSGNVVSSYYRGGYMGMGGFCGLDDDEYSKASNSNSGFVASLEEATSEDAVAEAIRHYEEDQARATLEASKDIAERAAEELVNNFDMAMDNDKDPPDTMRPGSIIIARKEEGNSTSVFGYLPAAPVTRDVN